MRIIGITGPSGAGKGKVSQILSSYGFKHIDADEVYHDIIKPPSPCLDDLVRNFGEEILTSDGCLDRKALGTIVFDPDNRNKLEQLNRITHRYVRSEIDKFTEKYHDNGEFGCVIDAPLLFEAGIYNRCDMTVAVIADEEIRANRIAKRDNISFEDAMLRIKAQNPESFYTMRTPYIIKNNTDEESIKEQLDKILSSLWSRGLG